MIRGERYRGERRARGEREGERGVLFSVHDEASACCSPHLATGRRLSAFQKRGLSLHPTMNPRDETQRVTMTHARSGRVTHHIRINSSSGETTGIGSRSCIPGALCVGCIVADFINEKKTAEQKGVCDVEISLRGLTA